MTASKFDKLYENSVDLEKKESHEVSQCFIDADKQNGLTISDDRWFSLGTSLPNKSYYFHIRFQKPSQYLLLPWCVSVEEFSMETIKCDQQ